MPRKNLREMLTVHWKDLDVDNEISLGKPCQYNSTKHICILYIHECLVET